jgi:FkbM family methyltransferase
MIRANSRDLNAVLAVGLGHEYPANLLHGLAADSTIIDCGAHIGSFAVFAARNHPSCRLVSIEPEEENYGLLHQNIMLNGLERRVKTIRAAVTPHDGSIQLWLNENNSGHSIVGGGAIGSRSQEVPGLSLQRIVGEFSHDRSYAIKIDIEGAEYDTLAASRPMVQNAVFVLMEWHSSSAERIEKWNWLATYFSELGFHGEVLHETESGGVGIWRKII